MQSRTRVDDLISMGRDCLKIQPGKRSSNWRNGGTITVLELLSRLEGWGEMLELGNLLASKVGKILMGFTLIKGH